MLESFLITFRETLEASLVVGIVSAQLYQTKQQKYNKAIYVGVGAAILTSILLAILFSVLASGFEGRTEAIFEGVTMIVGAILLTTMILWMNGKEHTKKLRKKVTEVEGAVYPALGIFFVVFFAIVREGVETIIFLHAIQYAGGISITWAILGVVVAIIVGYCFFKSSFKVKHFFSVSTALLILFAAGLFAHGIHEFEEAGVVSGIISPLYDINPSVHSDGTYPVFHEKGLIGSVLKGLFGYNGNPSLLEVVAYLLYLSVMGVYFYKAEISKSLY